MRVIVIANVVGLGGLVRTLRKIEREKKDLSPDRCGRTFGTSPALYDWRLAALSAP